MCPPPVFRITFGSYPVLVYDGVRVLADLLSEIKALHKVAVAQTFTASGENHDWAQFYLDAIEMPVEKRIEVMKLAAPTRE